MRQAGTMATAMMCVGKGMCICMCMCCYCISCYRETAE